MRRISIVLFLLLSALSISYGGREEDFRFAQKLYNDGYYDLAAEQFAKFIENYPDDARVGTAFYMQGKCLFTLSDWNGARTAFMRVALEFSDNRYAAEALFQAAFCLKNLGRVQDAARSFLGVGDYYPRSEYAAKGMVEAAGIYRESGDEVKARAAYERILNEFRGTESAASAYFNMAEMAEYKGDDKNALQYYESAGQSSEDETMDSMVKLRRAVLFNRAGDWDKAEQELEGVKSPIELFNYARLLKGIWQQKQGDLAGAEKLIKNTGSSSKVDSIKQKSNYYLGENYYLSGKYQEALDLLKGVPAGDSCSVMMGQIYLQLNKIDEAAGEFSRVLQLAGNNLYKMQALEGLKNLYGKGNLQSDISGIMLDYLPNLKGLPEWENYAETMGSIAFKAGNLDLAEGFLKELEGVNSVWSDDALYYRSVIAGKRKDFRKGLDLITKMGELYPGGDFAAEGEYLRAEFAEQLPPDNLVDEVAKMSTSVMDYKTKGEVSLLWGKGYYDNFKDYNKAAAHLQTALNSGELSKEQTGEALAYLVKTLKKLSFTNPVLEDSARRTMQSYLRNSPGGNYAGTFSLDLLRHQVSIITDPIQKKLSYMQGLEEIKGRYSGDMALPEVNADLAEIYAEMKEKAGMAVSMSMDLMSERKGSLARQKAILAAGRAFETLGDTAKGTAKFDEYIENYPKGYRIFSAYREKILAVSAATDKISALKLIIDKFYYNQATIVLSAELGELYMQTNDYAGALEILIPLSKNPDADKELKYKIALAYMRQGDLKKAEEYFLDYAVNSSGGLYWEEAVMSLGEISENEDKASSAIRFYENLLNRSQTAEKRAAVREKMAALYYKIGRYEEGRGIYKELIGDCKNPDKEIEYSAQNIVGLYKQNMLEEARQEALNFAVKYKKSPKLDEYQALFYLEKARALTEDKNFEEALKALDTIIKKYAKTKVIPEAEYEIGRINLINNKYDEALKILTAIPTKYPKHKMLPSVYITLGAFYYRQEQYQNALMAFQRVLDDKGAKDLWADAMQNLEVVYKELGLYEAAFSVVNRYLETFPYADDAVLKKLDAAQLLIRMKDYNRAVERLHDLLPQVTTAMKVEVQFYLGDAYFQKGDYQQAVLEFMKVKYLDPGGGLDWGVTAIYNAGKCYEKLGKLDEARSMYKEIIDRWGAKSDYGRAAQERIDFLKQYDKK